jgi:hypothetical protein
VNITWATPQLLVLLLGLVRWAPVVAQQLDANNWGKATPGVTLVAREGSREHSDQDTVLWYNLIGKGFPDGAVYNLWRLIPGKSPELLTKGVSFDKHGVLVCSGKPGYCSGAGPDDPVNLKTTASLGEEKRMAVVSEDGKIAGFADAVPFPIEATDKSCKLSVVRMSPLANVVLASASGLKPNQTLIVSKRYGYDSASEKYTAGPDGTWESLINTAPEMQPQGKASISLSDGSCTVSVTFDYGPGSNKPQ